MIGVPQFKNQCSSFDFAPCNPHDRTDRQRTTRVTTIYPKPAPQYPSESPESQSAHNSRSVNFWQSDPYLYHFQFSQLNIIILITGPLLSGDWRQQPLPQRMLPPRSSTFAMPDLSDAAWDFHGNFEEDFGGCPGVESM